MNNLLGIDGWDRQGKVLDLTYYSSGKKWLDAKAASFHNEVREINEIMLVGSYNIHTHLLKHEKSDGYVLKVKVKYSKRNSKK